MGSDGASVANAVSGVLFTRDFVRQHATKILEFKLMDPSRQCMSDTEVLKTFLDLKVIEPPRKKAG
jgi:hypothetical protein